MVMVMGWRHALTLSFSLSFSLAYKAKTVHALGGWAFREWAHGTWRRNAVCVRRMQMMELAGFGFSAENGQEGFGGKIGKVVTW